MHQLTHDVPLAGLDRRPVGRHPTLQPQPEFLRLEKRPVDLGAAQQRLGGDAAHVEADAADGVLFNEGHLRAKLSRPQRCHVAARPAAYNSDVGLNDHVHLSQQ